MAKAKNDDIVRRGSRWGESMSQNVVVETGSSTLAEGATVAPGQISVNAGCR